MVQAWSITGHERYTAMRKYPSPYRLRNCSLDVRPSDSISPDRRTGSLSNEAPHPISMTIRNCTNPLPVDQVRAFLNRRKSQFKFFFSPNHFHANNHLLEILHKQTDKVSLTQKQILSHRLQVLEQFVRTHNDIQHLLRCVQIHIVDHDVQFGIGNIGKYVIN